MQRWWWQLERWWYRTRWTIRGALFPLICLQFARTLIFPNPLDVFFLFVLFLLYLGFLFNMY